MTWKASVRRGNDGESIPVDGLNGHVRASLDDIGRAVGSERSSASLDLLKRYDDVIAPYVGTGVQILDITAQVIESSELWAKGYPDSEVNIVYSRTDGLFNAPGKENIYTSRTFGSDFWLHLAKELNPNVIISDGRISVYHQMQMFRILFPALGAGGTFILENAVGALASPRAGADKLSSHMVSFFYSLSKATAGFDEQFSRHDEFWDYCKRNIDSIEYFRGNVVVRKRSFDQSMLVAVPFKALARDHEILDEPVMYPRIPIEIQGSDYIAARVERILEEASRKLPPRAETGILLDAKIVASGIVTVEDKFIVKESFINQNHTSRRTPFYRIESSDIYVTEESIETYRDMPATETYIAAKQTWDANYGHWMVDTFPRLMNLANNFDLSHSRIVLSGNRSAAMKDVFADSLSLLGVPGQNLEWTDNRPIHFERLVYATPMSIPPLIKSELSIRNLEQLPNIIPEDSRIKYLNQRRIYLSRNKYPRRQLLNEQQILPIVERNGYEVVYPEELSLFDQIGLFSSADYVIGNMGAAFSSLAFSPKGVHVLALATEKMVHDYFYDIVCHKSGVYMGLQGIAEVQPGDIGSDFTVDVAEFERLFELFDSSEERN